MEAELWIVVQIIGNPWKTNQIHFNIWTQILTEELDKTRFLFEITGAEDGDEEKQVVMGKK